jgi:hypothetical protein
MSYLQHPTSRTKSQRIYHYRERILWFLLSMDNQNLDTGTTSDTIFKIQWTNNAYKRIVEAPELSEYAAEGEAA